MKVWSRVVIAAAGTAFALSAAVAYTAQAASPPSAPRNLKATAGDNQVTLTWSPPATGAPITNYQVITAPADFPRTTTTTTNLTVTGLRNGTVYSFAVRAANAVGYGPAARTTATPHVIPPSAPTNVAATTGPGAGQITLSWTPPTSTGSSPLNHYNVTVSPGGVSQQVGAGTTTYTASNLADNITYTFTVSATNNENGTGPAAVVYAPLPIGASLGLQPAAGGANTLITVTGQLFLKNENLTLYWDTSSHVATSVVTDENGSFTKQVKPFSGDKPGVHKICASVPPKPCANFSLQGAPTPTPAATPTPGETPTPSPSNSPVASGPRTGGGGLSGLDIITRPPFVFLPIIGIIGLLGVLAYWLMTRRRTGYSPPAATVTHRATRPDYMAPFPPAAAPPGAGPPASGQPGQSAWQAPAQTSWEQPAAQPPPPAAPPPSIQQPPPVPQPPSVQPPPAEPPPPVQPPPVQPPPVQPPPAPPAAPTHPSEPTVWPAAPDEPPDLPQPSD